MSKIDVAAFRRVADAGLTLIPLDGKKPKLKNWTTRPFENDDTIDQARRNGWNLGVRLTADHLVLDVDPRNGGSESLARLSQALGIDLPSWTPATHTGSGGLHLWMRKPSDMKIAGKINGYGPADEFWNYQPTTENVWDALLTIAERRVVNPLTDWLTGLHWDGVPRVESLFPQFFKTADDAYTRAVSRCFMVGAVKRAYEPGCKFDTMPVLKGKQGKSKSTGVKALFGAEWFSDAEMNLRDKDAAVMLMGKWVHEFE